MEPFTDGEGCCGMAGEGLLESARRGAIPSGIVTFLFTDIEGSTRRWDADRAAMTEALPRHDTLARMAIERCGGHVFKTVGDGFLCAFTAATDALEASIELARSLAAADFSAVGGLRVRIALHTGTADERDGDYFGPTLNRAARLLSTAHGEQIIVSGSTHEILRTSPTSSASFKDLGDHRLKDLTRPERVYQIVVPGLRADFPPLRSLTAMPNNLPSYLTSFIGRERELREIAALLESQRLVVLVGSGGIGKTRTSLQVAANRLDGSGDGVWLIELAPLASGDYIAALVAHAMGFGLPPDGDPVESLARALQAKRALLIFDNCEHLVEPAGRIIAALLRRCPGLRVLASSRQPLGITGERTYRLPSLDVPDDGGEATLFARDAVQSAAICLFVDRAHAVDDRFALTDANASAVADICRRLDGIPLAIELAAARVKILNPKQLRKRLDERFRVLTVGSRDALPRQQTLRAMIDWSYELLDDRERGFFARLGTFASGFVLESAAAVGVDDHDELAALDLLASLVDKSLVLSEPQGEISRYRLLESMRVYAREKLLAAGEWEMCAGRHARSLRDRFAHVRERYEKTARRSEVDDLLAAELEDVRVALDRSTNGVDVLTGAELFAGCSLGWGKLGLYKEGLARIEGLLAALPADESRLRARLATTAAALYLNSLMNERAIAAATQAVAQARMSEDTSTRASALIVYSLSVARLGRFDAAVAALAEAAELPHLARASRHQLLAAEASVNQDLGDLDGAAAAYADLRNEYRSLGNTRDEYNMTYNLADLEYERGRTEHAIALLREVLPAAREQSDPMLLVNVLSSLAGFLAATGDPVGASDSAREAIAKLAITEPESALVAIALEHLALGLALLGDVPLAGRLAGYANARLQAEGHVRGFTEATTHERLKALLGERLDADEFARLANEGGAMTAVAAVFEAIGKP